MKHKVLFVCIGNSCRSQMAEGFARAYGADVLTASSAGLMPAMSVASETAVVMEEKSIDIGEQFPKDFLHLREIPFDVIVNLSGVPLSEDFPGQVREWKVRDPVGCSLDVYRKVRDEIESRVQALILEMRR